MNMAHPNVALVERLFAALNRHDHDAMAGCYDNDQATFHDIAFHLERKPEIHDMWRMICEGESGIEVNVKRIDADAERGEARVLDRYRFGRDKARRKEGQLVVNEITSRFRFRDGRIIEHVDECDERAWAKQALGGPIGWIAGRSRFVRSLSATAKLKKFLRDHPATTSRAMPQS
jgi:ketosteroid isomerase-like protein